MTISHGQNTNRKKYHFLNIFIDIKTIKFKYNKLVISIYLNEKDRTILRSSRPLMEMCGEDTWVGSDIGPWYFQDIYNCIGDGVWGMS